MVLDAELESEKLDTFIAAANVRKALRLISAWEELEARRFR